MSKRKDFNQGAAAVLSLIIPGAGQVYKGQIFNGLFWFLMVVVGYVMFVVPGVILHIACIYGAYSGGARKKDCPQCGEQIMEEAKKCKHCGSVI